MARKPTVHEERKAAMRGKLETISRICKVTGRVYAVVVKATDYDRWKGGELTPNAFSYLDTADREFILSDTTPAEFDRLWGQEDQ